MKVCSKCNIEKDINDFAYKNKSKNIRHSRCRKCQSESDKQLYLNNSIRREKIRTNTNLAIKKAKIFVRRVKQRFGCKNCGDKRYYVLDFHHLHGKDNEISTLSRQGVTIQRLKDEIRKCTILCSNCHREVHYFEKLKGTQANLVEAQN